MIWSNQNPCDLLVAMPDSSAAMENSKKLQIELLRDAPVPLPGIYPKELKVAS